MSLFIEWLLITVRLQLQLLEACGTEG